jgi:hypothetical protein
MRARVLACVLGLLGVASAARAEQFVLTDVRYVHSAETTSDSHYRVDPSAETPNNWKSPVDYSTGSVHVLLEVKTKPAGNAETQFQVCLSGTPTYACTLQSPVYTKPGRYEWTSKFSELWSPAGKAVDWSKGLDHASLILKDNMNGKPQGDPKYVPSELHVEVAVVSAGSKYTPPDAPVVGAPPDAGSRDAGGADAALAVDQDATVPAVSDEDAAAPVPGGPTQAEAAARDAAAPTTDDSVEPAQAQTDEGASGCALTAGSRQGGLLLALALLLARRRARPHAG